MLSSSYSGCLQLKEIAERLLREVPVKEAVGACLFKAIAKLPYGRIAHGC